ncbi:MAG: DNA translocase FtsK [Clostridia bacterium]|nr:DNA translocase FtsK [Clostridia bacterium]
MAKTQEENNQPAKKKSSRRVNGIVITLIFFVLDLILLGAFSKAGQAVTNFLVGIFGYAIYGYSLALTVLGIFYILNLRVKQSKKIIFVYSLIVVTTITFAHVIGSHGYALNGWGNYISSSYKGADTAGGALASIFLYLFATKHIYILTLVANGIITVGLIAIAILLQVDIDINILSKKPKKVRGVSHSNLNVYNVDNQDHSQSLNNQTVKGKNLGERLFRRGDKNRLNDYQPIDSVNIASDKPNEVSQFNIGMDMGEYMPNYTQADPQLILDTQEIRNEVARSEFIYASEDVNSAENTATINSVQRDYLGIDGSQRLNVIDEGANAPLTQEPNQPEQQPPQMSQRERTQSIYERFQSNVRTSNDYLDNGHIPSYYSQMRKENKQQDDKGQEESPVVQNEQVENTTEALSFEERLDRILSSSNEQTDLSNFQFPTGVEKDVENTAEDKKINAVEESINEKVEKKKIEENKVEEKKVQDRTETRREESMDEYIARMNREKEASEPSPVSNYHATDDVKVDKPVENSDGYFQTTYDKPKPIVAKHSEPSATQKKQVNPTIDNGQNKKSTESSDEDKKESKPRVITPYIPPSIDNLNDYVPDVDDNEDFMERTRIIERTYGNFGIEVHVKNIVSGPSVTRYEFEIPETLSVDKIPSKLNNILMALAVETARIEAPIPGKSLCGIEVPNKVRKTVGLKEFLTSEKFKNKKGGLYFALGKDVDNNCHYEDLTDFPHGLIAGGTGSGKSVCLNTMLCSLIYKYSPEELRIILVDPKRVEFSKYQALPHLLTPKIYNTPKESLGILKWLCAEMERRYALFAKRYVAKISSYNATKEVIDAGETIPYIVTIIDEVGDIMVSEHAKEFETYVLTLAQKARACGIHLILATQRPSVDVITGNIKANLPTRIAFAVTTGTDSRTILDSIGAEDLLGKGDMLVKTTKSRYMIRLQNPFIDDMEIQNIMRDIVSHNSAYYDETIEAEIASISEPKKEESVGAKALEKIKEFDFPDDLCPDVLKRIVGIDNVSISWMQRAFAIGFARGGKIYDWLMACGYIEKQGSKCICLLNQEQVDEIIENARLNGGDDAEE